MAKSKPKRLVIIGIDSLIPEMVEKFVKEGNMPTLGSLMERGVFSPMWSSPVVDTPTNWTSLVTGAWTGTHGINTFSTHTVGQSFKDITNFAPDLFPTLPNEVRDHMNKHSRAEYLWQAAERAGKRSILVNYPGGWPPNIANGIVVDGSGPFASALCRLEEYVTYSTREAGATSEQQKISWTKVNDGAMPELAATLPLGTFDNPPTQQLRLSSSDGQRYDRLSLLAAEGGATVVLNRGEWSPWLEETIQIATGPVQVKVKWLLEELSEDGLHVTLLRSPIFNLDGWAYPKTAVHALVDDQFAREAMGLGRERRGGEEVGVADEHYVQTPRSQRRGARGRESVADQARGLGLVCNFLAQREPWDIFALQVHAPDGILHRYLSEMCPDWHLYSPEREQECWEIMRAEHRILDTLVADVLRATADDETLVLVVSDHGHIPTTKVVWMGQMMVDAGLMVYKQNEETGMLDLDRSKSKIILGDHPLAQNVWVNLKGRYAEGIVEPEDFGKVCDETIDALYAARDPETGERLIELALTAEAAAFMGQWGPQVGDIVYFYKAGWCSHNAIFSALAVDPAEIAKLDHGVARQEREIGPYKTPPSPLAWWAPRRTPLGIHKSHLPTTKYCGISNQATFLMAGPNVKQGYRLRVPLWTPDVVPTICLLTGLPLPAQCEGKAVVEALTVL